MIEAKPISFGIFGPASPVVDNAIAAFDGSARRIQSRAVTIDDNGNIVLPANGAIKVADGNPQIVFDNANNWLEITGNIGVGTNTPTIGVNLHLKSADASVWMKIEAGAAKQAGFILDGDRDWRFVMKGNESDQFVLRDHTGGSDRLTISTTGDFIFASDSNIGVAGANQFGSMEGGMVMALGADPTADIANQFAFFAHDFAAGNTCPYFRSENGTIIGLNQSLLTTDNVAFGTITLASTKWLGLAVDKGRLVFTDAATDNIAFMGCNVGIGTASPVEVLDVVGNIKVSNNIILNTAVGLYPVIKGATHTGTTTMFGGDGIGGPALQLNGQDRATSAGYAYLFTPNVAQAAVIRLQITGNVDTADLSIVNSNLGLGTTTFGASMAGGMVVALGTDPTGDVADQFAMYAADIVAGNTAPHFRTENTKVIKLYQQAHIADSGGDDAATVNAILTVLENLGFLATS